MAYKYYITNFWGYGEHTSDGPTIRCEYDRIHCNFLDFTGFTPPLLMEGDENGNVYEYLTGTLLYTNYIPVVSYSRTTIPLKRVCVIDPHFISEVSPVEFEEYLNKLSEKNKKRLAEQFRFYLKKAELYEENRNREREQNKESNQTSLNNIKKRGRY